MQDLLSCAGSCGWLKEGGGEGHTAIILQALLSLPLVIYEIFRESGMWVDHERNTMNPKNAVNVNI